MQGSHKRKPIAFKVEGLSITGRELVDAMLAKGCTYDAIIKALNRKTGEVISDSSLARYRAARFLEPATKKETARRTHQMLGEIKGLLIEIRDAIRGLNARQLWVVGGGAEPPKTASEEKKSGD